MTECPNCRTIFQEFQEQVRKNQHTKKKNCEVCNALLSRRAPACPKCGDPQILEKQPSTDMNSNDFDQYVILTGFDIPFGELVGFLAKLAIAAVPAGFIVYLFWSMVIGLFSALSRLF